METSIMTWLSFLAVILVIQAGAIVLGYWMGRNSAHQPLSSQSKTFNPGLPGVEHDPYADALEPDAIGKRIPTV